MIEHQSGTTPAAADGCAHARRLFLDDPSLSIDEVARALSNEGLGISKDTISGIRREVRQLITAAGQQSGTQRVVLPFVRRREKNGQLSPITVEVRPQMVQHIQETLGAVPGGTIPGAQDHRVGSETAQPATGSIKTTAPAAEPVSVPEQPLLCEQMAASTTQERRQWLETWMLEHPQATVNEAREALRGHFQVTLGTPIIAEVVRLTHEAAGYRRAGSRTEAIADLAHQMRKLGVRKIETLASHYRVELD